MLIEIFDKFSVIELVNLCDTSPQFRNLIVNRVVSRKLIDLAQLRLKDISTVKVFKLFGKTMTKVKVSVDDLPADIDYIMEGYSKTDVILKLFIDYGKRQTLTELDLECDFNDFTGHTAQLLHDIVPYFEKITNLRLKNYQTTQNKRSNGWCAYLTRFSFKELESLELDHIFTDGHWLYTSSIESLQRMRMIDSEIENIDCFKKLITNNRNFKSFSFDSKVKVLQSVAGFVKSDKYYEVIANFAPHIEEIGTIIDVYRMGYEDLFHPKPYLKEFNNLKSIQVTSVNGLNLRGLFYGFTEENALETLKINFVKSYRNDFFLLPDELLQKFANLSNLHLINVNNISDTQRFMPNFLSKIPKLTECHVTGNVSKSILELILHSAKNLRFLYVESNAFRKTAAKEFYSSLIRVRKGAQGIQCTPLTIYFDEVTVNNWRDKIGDSYDGKIIHIQSLGLCGIGIGGLVKIKASI